MVLFLIETALEGGWESRRISYFVLAVPLNRAILLLLHEMQDFRERRWSGRVEVGFKARVMALDIFEMMIRVDDLALSSGLSGLHRELDHWAIIDGASVVRRLRMESRSMMLATLLTLGPKGLAGVAEHMTFFEWMEVVRAANNLTLDQLRAIAEASELESYLLGRGGRCPKLRLPIQLPLPLPSALRAVQSARFRWGLFRGNSTEQAFVRYFRFFAEA